MKLGFLALCGVAAGALAATPVTAQTVIGLATTAGGATEQIATGLAKAISENSDLQVRPQVQANTSQYLPLVNSGKVEFGIANAPQTSYAISGTGMSQGQKNENLKMVAVLFPFNTGLLVAASSPIKTFADLKGKKLPRFSANSLGDFLIRTGLAAGKLTYNDVVSVPTANFPRHWDALKQGQTDLAIATVGSQITLDLNAALKGVRYISYTKADASEVAKLLPGTTLRSVPSTPQTPGNAPGTLVMSFDYTMFAAGSVPDALVEKVVKALHSGVAGLKKTGPIWAEMEQGLLSKNIGLQYHPGAIKAYKALGIWKG
jgi:TRAP transporter TAXI family solute receptor